jgi:hypothetical protein
MECRRRIMKRTFFVYAALSIGLAVAGVLISNGNLMIMIDFPSLALLLGPTVFMLLSHYGPRECIAAFRAAMAGNGASERELRNAVLFFSTAQNLMIASTVIATFLGIIMILDDLGRGNTESPRAVAWWMAVDFISVLYLGFGMLLLTMPFKSAVQKRLNEMRG